MTDLTKAIKLAEAASEQLQKSHVKQYTRGDGTVVQEHDDSRQKKAAPPQADSNRHKWDDLHDDHNPKYALRGISSKELGKAAKGKTDLKQRAKEELASRGVDEHGQWLGFDAAAKHHGTEGAKQKSDEIDGHMQTMHHKVLGAIATGHTDPKRLAREELANRGHDHDGNWIGFDKAAKLHRVE